MKDIKIITHTTYTYETSDGREFNDEQEAKDWQAALDTIEDVRMLSSRFNPTNDVDSAFYVYIKDDYQRRAFNAIQADMGLNTRITEVGYYYYDDVADEYINIENKIKELQGFIDLLNK
jgi:hypothetical protein